MSRTGVTYHEVAEAAIALQLNGETPTIDKIRAHLGGTGSNSTISKYLNQWRQNGSPDLLEAKQPPPDVVQAAVEQVWSQMREKTNADIEVIKTESQRLVEAADERAKTAEVNLNLLKNEYDDLQQTYFRVSGEKEILAIDMKNLQEAHQSLEERYAAYQLRHEEMKINHGRELEDKQRLHEAELVRLDEKAKQTIQWCEELLVEVRNRADHERLQSIELLNEQKRQYDMSQKEVNELQKKCEEQMTMSTQLQSRIELLLQEKEGLITKLADEKQKNAELHRLQQENINQVIEKFSLLTETMQSTSSTLQSVLAEKEILFLQKLQEMENKLESITEKTEETKLSAIK